MRCALLILNLFLLNAGASSDLVPKIYTHGSRLQAKVAITFDACPAKDARYDSAVIETLRREKVPATLFLSGRWMEKFPEQTRELAKDPLFELGVHGYRHRNLVKATDAQLIEEFEKPKKILKTLTKHEARLYRPPFGIVDDRVARAAQKNGLNTIQFDLASGDPDPKLEAEKLVSSVVKSAKNGSIIVFHMNGRGWKTSESLPKVIAGLRARGFELVTVSEILRTPERKLAQRARK